MKVFQPSLTVSVLNNTMTNIFSNYIPKRYVAFDDKDPPWLTEKIKNKTAQKNSIYKSYIVSSKHSCNYQRFQCISGELFYLIEKTKKEHHNNLSMRLNNLQKSTKTYWFN